ncbi:hypothetical protein ASG01_00690 [Chryseobacterium sp. Leaf180]|nr:hypothetical protein ASG01_00690 [Chryseobacterium sp. Leaf180]
MIDGINDTRRGITLLTRLSQPVIENIERFQNELRQIDQHQYEQPSADLHLTILSLISCYAGFSLNDIHVQDYMEIIAESVLNIRPFSIRFRGITASKDAVMIQGFPQDDSLEIIRERLRTNLKKTSLQQSVDSRYKITTAHITAVRFRKELNVPSGYAAALQRFRNFDFGEITVSSLDLVFNDWYQKKDIVRTLHRFALK